VDLPSFSRASSRALAAVGVTGVVAALVAVVAVPVAVSGCDDGLGAQNSCVNIPDGGCPLSNGIACSDPNCAATYSCQSNGSWVLEQVCPPNDAAISNPVPPPDAAFVDAPAGQQGCPDLEFPDCSATTAASCAACCGCEDVWVCGGNGTWVSYGYCDDNGVLHVSDGGI
jgi:hypothetical protein